MTADSWWIIKIALGVISGIFGLLAAILAFWEIAQNEKHTATRIWFAKRWTAINNSIWLSMPETIIRLVIDFKKYVLSVVKRSSEMAFYKRWSSFLVLVSGPVIVVITSYVNWGIYGACITLVFVLPFILLLHDEIYRIIAGKLSRALVKSYTMAIFAGTVILLTWHALNIDILVAAGVMVVLLPIFWFYLLLPLGFVVEKYAPYSYNTFKFFAVAVSMSFAITFLALLIGHFFSPGAWLPQKLQMVVSNVVFDGFTMIVTIALLSWAIKGRTLLRIPCVIFADVIIAGLFACGSLYVGLVFTDKSLNFVQIWNILVGRSPSGEDIQLGPYFWTMHTTFLPTLAYLLLIMVGWIGKTLLIPVRWFFGLGQENKNPLKLTAGLLTVFAVVFGCLSYIAGVGQDHAKEKGEKTMQPVSENVMIGNGESC